MIEGKTSVGPEDKKEKYFTLYFLVSRHAVIGQVTRPYSAVLPAKI